MNIGGIYSMSTGDLEIIFEYFCTNVNTAPTGYFLSSMHFTKFNVGKQQNEPLPKTNDFTL